MNGSVNAHSITGVNPSVINTHILGPSAIFLYRLNTACFGGSLYFAALDLELGSPPTQFEPLKIATTASLLASSPVISQINTNAVTFVANKIFNVMPLGNCLLAVIVADNSAGGGQPVLIYRTDGSIVEVIYARTTFPGYYLAYNYIAIPGYRTYTPNSFIIP